MSLYSLFRNNTGRTAEKWCQYLPIYEKHLKQYVNRSIIFFEIGVRYGGSLDIWRNFLGPHAIIVGIDIDPHCKCIENQEDNIYIEIGDQKDLGFMQYLVKKYGSPNIVLDDGSHRSIDINASFDYLFPSMPDNSTYIVEDLHTCYWDSYIEDIPKKDTFTNRMKEFIDQLNLQHIKDKSAKQLPQLNNLVGMHVYDSIAVFDKMIHFNTQRFQSGSNSEDEQIILNPKRRRANL